MLTDKEIIQASKEFSQNTFSIRPELVEDSFIEGAKWADKKITEKVCDWLRDNMCTIYICENDEYGKPIKYVCVKNCYSIEELLIDFRQEMEE